MERHDTWQLQSFRVSSAVAMRLRKQIELGHVPRERHWEPPDPRPRVMSQT